MVRVPVRSAGEACKADPATAHYQQMLPVDLLDVITTETILQAISNPSFQMFTKYRCSIAELKTVLWRFMSAKIQMIVS